MFACTCSEGRLSIAMSAELRNIDAACREAECFIDDNDLASNRFAVLLGLREALTNAIVHGSCNDKDLPVRLELKCVNTAIHIQVEDQGGGFDWLNASTTPPSDPRKIDGRGLAIIHEYFDEVGFNEVGNAIRFSKKI